MHKTATTALTGPPALWMPLELTGPDRPILRQANWEGTTLFVSNCELEVTKGRPSMHTLKHQLYNAKGGNTKLDMVQSYTSRTSALLIPPNRLSEGYVSPGFSFLLLSFGLQQNHFPFFALSLLGAKRTQWIHIKEKHKG